MQFLEKKIRQIILVDFPGLEPLLDCLYEDPGRTVTKCSGGTGEWILVEKKIPPRMYNIPNICSNCPQHRGGVPLIMGYVDDVSATVPSCDVEDF